MMGLKRIIRLPETLLRLELCWQSRRKALPPTVLTFYREMQSVGERQTHPQITDGEVKTEGMHGMQQPGINQLSYNPAQCHAIKLLLQACNHPIKQTWVTQSTYQSVQRCNNSIKIS